MSPNISRILSRQAKVKQSPKVTSSSSSGRGVWDLGFSVLDDVEVEAIPSLSCPPSPAPGIARQAAGNLSRAK